MRISIVILRIFNILRGCGKEEEVLKIVHSCIDMAMAYVLHRVFLNIMHVIFLVFLKRKQGLSAKTLYINWFFQTWGNFENCLWNLERLMGSVETDGFIETDGILNPSGTNVYTIFHRLVICCAPQVRGRE